MTQPTSPNFGFLAQHDQQLAQLGALAERYFASDPNTCLLKLRQYGEYLLRLMAARVRMYDVDDDRQISLMRRLQDEGVLKPNVYALFDDLRRAGNEANHAFGGNQLIALNRLKDAMFDTGFSAWLAINDQDINGFGWLKIGKKDMVTAQGTSSFDIYLGKIKLDGTEYVVPVHVGKNLTEVLLGRQWLEIKELVASISKQILTLG